MSISLNNQTCGASTFSATSPLTFSHTTNTGTNSVLFVVAWCANSISSVTYNGVSLGSPIVSVGLDGGASAVYQMIAPPTGANNVVITTSASAQIMAQAFTLDGVNQVTPSDNTIQGYYGGVSPISQTITSPSGNWGILILGDRGGDTNTTLAGSGGATLIGGTIQSAWLTAASFLLSSGPTVSPGISYSGGASNSPEYMGFDVNAAASASNNATIAWVI